MSASRILVTLPALATSLCLLTGTVSAWADEDDRPPAFTITDLGTLGGTFSLAWGINDKSEVSGVSSLPGDQVQRAFVWKKGTMTDLGTLGGPNSSSEFPLNDKGAVTGTAQTSATDPVAAGICNFPSANHLACRAFTWHRGRMTALPTLGGINSAGTGINDRGQQTGLAETLIPNPGCELIFSFKPFLWERGKMEALPTFPGDVNGGSLAINDKGQAIGWSGACTTPLHALLWQDDSVMDLGSLGGEAPHLPFGINNRGQVVGFSSLPGDTTVHAFLWHDGVMTDLGTLPGDVASLADDINGEGQVVGTSFDAEGNPRAFLWHKGRMTDLNSLIRGGSSLVLLEASSINSRGDIAGYGFLPSTGEIHAFLARPKRQKFRREIDATTDEIGVAVLPAEVNRSHMDTLPEGVGRLLQQRLITAPFGGRAKRP